MKLHFKSSYFKGIFALTMGSVFVLGFQNCGAPFESVDLGLQVGGVSFDPNNAFSTQAMGILESNCKTCHVDQALGNVANILDINHLVDSGLIRPGDLNSPLLQSIEQNRMPPTGVISETNKLLLRNWVLALGGRGTLENNIDLDFEFDVSTDPLVFPIRLNKLAAVIGPNQGSSLDSLIQNRFLLGDYNFSNSAVPNFAWGPSEIRNWSENLEPFCASSNFVNQFTWANAPAQIMQRAYGRTPDAQDTAIINEINALSVNDQEKIQILCLTLLSSLEFTAK